jgi:hypothetical protein
MKGESPECTVRLGLRLEEGVAQPEPPALHGLIDREVPRLVTSAAPNYPGSVGRLYLDRLVQIARLKVKP